MRFGRLLGNEVNKGVVARGVLMRLFAVVGPPTIETKCYGHIK